MTRKTAKPEPRASEEPKPARKKPGPKPGQISIRAKKKAEREERKKQAAEAYEIKLLEFRKRILGLREQGASIRQISEQLLSTDGEQIGDFGCKPTSVFNHLVASLDDLWKNYQLSTKNYAQLRLNQMQRIELAHFKKLQNPDLSAIDFDRLTAGMDRIWKRMDDMIDELTGRNRRPIKLDIRDSQKTLAKLIGKSPEELPSGDVEP